MHLPICWRLAVPVLLFAGCTQSNVYQEPPPPKVKVASPVVQTVINYLEETATTEAVAKVEIRARVQGNLDAVHVQPGSEVNAGDLLYEIEPELYQARVEFAEADLLAQKARAKKARLEKERQEKMRAQDVGATSESAVVEAQAAFESAQAAVKQAESQLKQAQINNGYTKIHAPISGRVGKSLVKQGNLVGGNEATLLTTVIQYDPIYANFNISERMLLELMETKTKDRDGKLANQEIVIFLRRETDEGFPFEGHFDYADLAVDQSTGTFMIRGIFPNPGKRILPGLFVTVRLPISTRENAVLVPERAVAEDQAGQYLFVVNSENEVARRGITSGSKVGDLLVITEGLSPEDTVIVDGLQRARSGAKVNPERIRLAGEEAIAQSVSVGSTQPPSASAESDDGLDEVGLPDDQAPAEAGDTPTP